MLKIWRNFWKWQKKMGWKRQLTAVSKFSGKSDQKVKISSNIKSNKAFSPKRIPNSEFQIPYSEFQTKRSKSIRIKTWENAVLWFLRGLNTTNTTNSDIWMGVLLREACKHVCSNQCVPQDGVRTISCQNIWGYMLGSAIRKQQNQRDGRIQGTRGGRTRCRESCSGIAVRPSGAFRWSQPWTTTGRPGGGPSGIVIWKVNIRARF